jgi:hypothetical protein
LDCGSLAAAFLFFGSGDLQLRFDNMVNGQRSTKQLE